MGYDIAAGSIPAGATDRSELILAESKLPDTKRNALFPQGAKMKPKFHRSFDVQTLIDILAKMSIGDTIPAAKLAGATGDDPKSQKFYGKLASARRVVEREQRIVTTLDGGIVTRLADAAIVSTASDVIQRVRRTSLRGLKKLGCVDYDKLTNAEKTKHDASASHLGILAECSRPNTVAKIEAKVQEKTAKLTFDETLRAFRQ